MLTPYRLRWEMCILQTWTLGSDANKHSHIGLRVPTWVTLRGIPGEFMKVSNQIASGLRVLLGGDNRSAVSSDQRFCVAMEAGVEWRTLLSVSNEATGKVSLISVDYCNLPIRCQFCLSTNHLVKECTGTRSMKEIGGRENRTKTPPQPGASATSVPQAPSSTNLRNHEVELPLPPTVVGQNPTILVGSSRSLEVRQRSDPEPSSQCTVRSGNHYSNGESRLTPEHEWNG